MLSCCAIAQEEESEVPAPGDQPTVPEVEALSRPCSIQQQPRHWTSAQLGYLHQFDPESRPSIFGVTGQYTSTDSIVGGAFARTSFDEDHQRLNAGLAYGNIKNDYNDYLGTGVPLRNNAGLKSFISRYLYRVYGDWFVGVQGIYQNFAIAGDTAFDDLVLDILGVAPSK
jgi:hypothetical protein